MSGQDVGKRLSEERLRRALQAGRIVAWEWDLETGHLTWSDNAREVLGWASDVARDFDKRVHSDDQDRHQSALQRTFSEGLPYDVEIRFIRPDGTVIWIKDAGEVLTDSKGRRILSGVTIDITARKQMEERLGMSEERLRLTQNGVGIGLWEIDLQTGQLILSPESLLMHGLPADPPGVLAGSEAWLARIHPDDRAHAKAAFEQAIATRGLYDVIFRVPIEDGGIRWIHGLGRAIFDPGGAPLRFVGLNIDATMRKEAEAEAREKAAFLEATLQHMDQGLMMFDASEIVQIYNQQALDLLELPPELLAGKPTFKAIREYQLTHGEFVHSSEAFRQWVASQGVAVERDLYERTRPNGTVLEIRTVPLPDGGAVRTYTDVTAQRRAESELRESEERFRALATASASIVWQADPHGSILDGAAWTDFTGQFRSGALAQGWQETVHPDDHEQMIAKWQAALSSGELYENEYRLRRADGEYRWMYSRGVPIKNPDGSIREWVGTITDIHEQRLAREELVRSEARYRLLAENAIDIIATVDLQGIRRYLSPACRDVLGYEPEELVGQRVADFVHPEDREGLVAATCQLKSQPLPQLTQTYRHRHKDGSWIWLESRRRPVRDPQGRPVEFVSVMRDVTERRQIEEQLRQAQKMEAVGQLTGGVAHDFNNLLTVILGNAEILAQASIDRRHRALARMIEEAASRGADLTQKLLAFGRRQSLKLERLALNEVMQDVMGLLKRTLGEHIEIRTAVRNTRSVALTDRTLLESAILNLALNARDAMPQGGKLTIRTGETTAGSKDGNIPEGQPVVFVTVADTGCGMSPEVLSRAFEPFFTTKEVGRGSGLGLSMVYGFAQQSSGHVKIQSRKDKGTSVTILLPAVTREAEQAPVSTSTSLDGGRERILLVEDEPSVRQFVCAQLTSLGYQVEAVATGPEALKVLVRDSDFDLLLTDVVLPQGMSGVELARRAKEFRPGLKVLLTSGYPEESFRDHGRPGANMPLLRKPFRRKELAEALRTAVEHTAS